ncbi:MAG: hypothetical protein AAB654_05805, partial [Acidobacteriota bacterium]
SLRLRTHSTNLVTDASWERAWQRPETWPAAEAAAASWEGAGTPGDDDMLPRMNFWQVAPNGFVGMQSGQQLLRPWRGWPAERQRAPAYLRKVFDVPAGAE